MALVRAFPVKDRNGDRLTVYEFHDGRFLKRIRRMKLCSGETVQLIEGQLVVIGTGERLTPV